MRRFRVKTSRMSEFEKPIKVIKGEEVECIEDSNPNGDWLVGLTVNLTTMKAGFHIK